MDAATAAALIVLAALGVLVGMAYLFKGHVHF